MAWETAHAKINLALHVRGKRADGFHEIETLFAFVALGDRLRVEPAAAPSFEVTGPFAAALAGEGDNLVTRAAAHFEQAFAGGSHAILLEKNLPVASGIGGGSADAAATIRSLARLHGVDLSDPRLFEIADALGSDVPACLYQRTALGQGRGERLRPAPGMPGAPVLLVNPGVALSTAQVFRGWKGEDRGPIADAPLLDAARQGGNDLEAPARALAPVIGELLERLVAQPGVLLVRMSGSGATCFALFDSAKACSAAAAALERPGWWVAPTELL